MIMYLRYNGYKIKHVMNITDVGHLVSDGDDGEDKMIKSAKEENKTPKEIAEQYTKLFFDDIKEKYHDKSVLIVAHGGIAKVIKAHLYGMPESQNLAEISMNNCEIIETEI